MTPLAKYLFDNSLTIKEFSEKLSVVLGGRKVSVRTVENWTQGRSMPRKAMLEAIGKVTDKAVSADSFVGGVD